MTQDMWTKAPYLPIDKPPDNAATRPTHLPTNALIAKNLCKCTPARTAFISGTPEPSESLLMYSLNIFKNAKFFLPYWGTNKHTE